MLLDIRLQQEQEEPHKYLSAIYKLVVQDYKVHLLEFLDYLQLAEELEALKVA
jgi:hypothetical protein